MRTDPIGGIRLKRLAGLLAVASLALAACSGGTASSAPSAGAAASGLADKKLEIAYLSFAVANSYDAPMLAAAKAAAAAGNANLTVFDANLVPADQVKQLQDATASGRTNVTAPTSAGLRS